MSDIVEKKAGALGTLLGRAQVLHRLALVATLFVFFFGAYQLAQASREKSEAETEARELKAIKVYSQVVIDRLRLYILEEHAENQLSERNRIFQMLAAIRKTQIAIIVLQDRVAQTGSDLLSIEEVDGFSRLNFVEMLDEIKNHLYFAALGPFGGADLGQVGWPPSIGEASLDDIARIGIALSARPGAIHNRLKRWADHDAKKPRGIQSRDEVKDLHSTLAEIRGILNGPEAAALRFESKRLWDAWSAYLQDRSASAANLSDVSYARLAGLHEAAASKQRALESWLAGKREVDVPGLPGGILLSILLAVAPYVVAAILVLMILHVGRATMIATSLDSGEKLTHAHLFAFANEQFLVGDANSVRRFLGWMARIVQLGCMPLAFVAIGFLVPFLDPATLGTFAISHWIGTILVIVLAVYYWRVCDETRAALTTPATPPASPPPPPVA